MSAVSGGYRSQLAARNRSWWAGGGGLVRLGRVNQAVTTQGRAPAVPRAAVIAHAWLRLGPAVAPLSNSGGRPLARTVKLILDPLVLRPSSRPDLAGTTVTPQGADTVRDLIASAGDTLAATAAWFTLAKRTRRGLGVVDGNPQDLYFPRCYELAHLYGSPETLPDGGHDLAAGMIAEVHASRGGRTVEGLRGHITDPDRRAALSDRLARQWNGRSRPTGTTDPAGVDTFLSECVRGAGAPTFTALVDTNAGSAASADLDEPGTAAALGLTDHEQPVPPVLGDKASKNQLPKPFDRSILERLFAAFTSTFHRQSLDDIPSLVDAEIERSAGAWQLAEEPSRVTLALGRRASDALRHDDPVTETIAHTRLAARWRREAYTHRVLRLPGPDAEDIPQTLRDEIRGVRGGYLRRLWVRVHGLELRHETVNAAQVWDLLDGVLRSVILDQRDRLRTVLTKGRQNT